jgi:alpha-beta hydrolase superfamily lysophospholipase
VVVVHGLKDYGDRYADFARTLAEHGYEVWAVDLRGHGDSTGRRVWVEAFDEYVDDVELVMKRARLALPGKPVFLFGHSMGGAVATIYALNRTPEPSGLLLSGAALKTTASGGQVVAVKLFSALAPLLALFELDDSKFSRDASVVAAMKKDPLIYDGAAPVRTAAQVLTAIERIEGHCQELRVPLLAMHGSDDEVTPPEGSKALVACARSQDKTFKSYDGLYHDLLHEPEKAQVTADVLQWLDAHTR